LWITVILGIPVHYAQRRNMPKRRFHFRQCQLWHNNLFMSQLPARFGRYNLFLIVCRSALTKGHTQAAFRLEALCLSDILLMSLWLFRNSSSSMFGDWLGRMVAAAQACLTAKFEDGRPGIAKAALSSLSECRPRRCLRGLRFMSM
jgi:hypothetical protein